MFLRFAYHCCNLIHEIFRIQQIICSFTDKMMKKTQLGTGLLITYIVLFFLILNESLYRTSNWNPCTACDTWHNSNVAENWSALRSSYEIFYELFSIMPATSKQSVLKSTIQSQWQSQWIHVSFSFSHKCENIVLNSKTNRKNHIFHMDRVLDDSFHA